MDATADLLNQCPKCPITASRSGEVRRKAGQPYPLTACLDAYFEYDNLGNTLTLMPHARRPEPLRAAQHSESERNFIHNFFKEHTLTIPLKRFGALSGPDFAALRRALRRPQDAPSWYLLRVDCVAICKRESWWRKGNQMIGYKVTRAEVVGKLSFRSSSTSTRSVSRTSKLTLLPVLLSC